MKLGATGKFPKGKLDETDEGELTLAVVIDDNNMVRIMFGKRVSWIALDYEDTTTLTQILLKAATKVKENESQPN